MKVIQLCLSALIVWCIVACEKAGDVIIEEVEEQVTPGLEIVSATVSPAIFTYGDEVTLAAHVTDAKEELSALEIAVKVNGRTLVTRRVILTGNSAEVNEQIKVPFTDNAPGETVKFALKVINAKGGATTGAATATVNRPNDDTVYLVLSDGTVYPLAKSVANPYKYENDDLILGESFIYRIAQRIIPGTNQIDYTGFVIGSQNGRTQIIDESGSGISTTLALLPGTDYIASFAFDIYAFKILSTGGGTFQTPNFVLDDRFVAQTISSENFRRARGTTLTNGETYWIYGEMASPEVIWNVDFFDRINNNQVQFLGETSNSYTVYYNPVRKNVLVAPENPTNGSRLAAAPAYLVAAGNGMGIPTKLTSAQIGASYSGKGRTTTDWGFDNVLQYVVCRRLENNIYQLTVYMPGDHDHYLGLGIYDNGSWNNQQNAREYTILSPDGMLRRHNEDAADISFYIYGPDDGFPVTQGDYFRLSMDIVNKTMEVKKYDINTYSVVESSNPVTRLPLEAGVVEPH
ncbi:MAG: hypothetical protein LBB85_10695 [Dysgonamonadaceae bacterium]|jgi:hypothetical protein|nr:hypothetical protein [Dysgonamonadaceae bacterium]